MEKFFHYINNTDNDEFIRRSVIKTNYDSNSADAFNEFPRMYTNEELRNAYENVLSAIAGDMLLDSSYSYSRWDIETCIYAYVEIGPKAISLLKAGIKGAKFERCVSALKNNVNIVKYLIDNDLNDTDVRMIYECVAYGKEHLADKIVDYRRKYKKLWNQYSEMAYVVFLAETSGYESEVLLKKGFSNEQLLELEQALIQGIDINYIAKKSYSAKKMRIACSIVRWGYDYSFIRHIKEGYTTFRIYQIDSNLMRKTFCIDMLNPDISDVEFEVLELRMMGVISDEE